MKDKKITLPKQRLIEAYKLFIIPELNKKRPDDFGINSKKNER